MPAGVLADHPLITEDTGVLGKGRRQLEVHGERVRDAHARATRLSAVLGYGITDRADFQVEVPEKPGDASVALKWRFVEREALGLVFKPQLQEGGKWGLNLVAGYEAGRVEVFGHAGYLRNRSEARERRSLTHLSAALLFAATQKLKLALDLGRDTNPDPGSGTPVRELVYGLLYALSESVDLGLGYKKGQSEPADDRSLLFGMKLRF